MRHRMLLGVLLLLACVLGTFATASAADSQRRLALVIGNSAYDPGALKNPVNDANAMAENLRAMGFEVIHLENANQAMMEDAVKTLSDQLAAGGVGLFYYAGHGVQSEGRNYLIPVQALFYQESDLAKKAVDASWVLERMESANNDLNIVILDACRNNPFTKRLRSSAGPSGLAPMDAPKGSLVAFATSPGSVASDGAGANGVYTKHLLESMRSPGLSVEQMFKRVRAGVLSETGGKQRPWETTSILGDFSFLQGAGASLPDWKPAPAAKPAAQPVSRSGAINVEFAMMRENGGKPPTAVKPDDVLKSGESYFFHIKPNKECYLYLFQVDATGSLFRLYPNAKFNTGGNPLSKGVRVTIPNEKEVFFLDKTTGKEEFYFLASHEPLPPLEQIDAGGVDAIMRAGISLRGPAGVRAVTAKVITSSTGETLAHIQEFSFAQSAVHALTIKHE